MFLCQLIECGMTGFERLESVCWNCRFGEIWSWPGTLRIMSSMRWSCRCLRCGPPSFTWPTGESVSPSVMWPCLTSRAFLTHACAASQPRWSTAPRTCWCTGTAPSSTASSSRPRSTARSTCLTTRSPLTPVQWPSRSGPKTVRSCDRKAS